jgi:hypothetical protein
VRAFSAVLLHPADDVPQQLLTRWRECTAPAPRTTAAWGRSSRRGRCEHVEWRGCGLLLHGSLLLRRNLHRRCSCPPAGCQRLPDNLSQTSLRSRKRLMEPEYAARPDGVRIDRWIVRRRHAHTRHMPRVACHRAHPRSLAGRNAPSCETIRPKYAGSA